MYSDNCCLYIYSIVFRRLSLLIVVQFVHLQYCLQTIVSSHCSTVCTFTVLSSDDCLFSL